MNRKGQTMGLAIMGGIFVFIIGMLSVNFLFDEVTTARTSLTCSSASTISDATKLLCLVFDITIPYWIWIVLSLAGGIIITKLAIG